MPKTILLKTGLTVLILLAILTGGEFILQFLEEAADLALEFMQFVLIYLYQSIFGLDHAQAQNKAAWTSLFIIVLAVFVAAIKLVPIIRRKIAKTSTQIGAALGWWRTLGWFKKSVAVSGGLIALTLLVVLFL
jgi:uncharacterized membrane protein SirB2